MCISFTECSQKYYMMNDGDLCKCQEGHMYLPMDVGCVPTFVCKEYPYVILDSTHCGCAEDTYITLNGTACVTMCPLGYVGGLNS